jgi:hypothetical protein
MNDKDQKIIHRWDYEFGKPTWTTQSSKNISKMLCPLEKPIFLAHQVSQ